MAIVAILILILTANNERIRIEYGKETKM